MGACTFCRRLQQIPSRNLCCRVGDFQVATSGGFWVAIRVLAVVGGSCWGGTLSGLIFDTHSMEPISAEVSLTEMTGQSVVQRTARANETGLFEISGLPAGHLHLATKLPGYVTEHLSLSLLEDENRSVTLYLSRGHTIRGRVVDSKNDPVSNAVVSIAYKRNASVGTRVQASFQWERGEVRTDVSGNFALRNVDLTKAYRIEVVHPDYSTYVSDSHLTGKSDDEPVWTIGLQPKSPLFGFVTNELGNPISGVHIQLVCVSSRIDDTEFLLSSAPCVRETSVTSDSLGRFDFGVLSEAEFLLRITDDRFDPFESPVQITGEKGHAALNIRLKAKRY